LCFLRVFILVLSPSAHCRIMPSVMLRSPPFVPLPVHFSLFQPARSQKRLPVNQRMVKNVLVKRILRPRWDSIPIDNQYLVMNSHSRFELNKAHSTMTQKTVNCFLTAVRPADLFYFICKCVVWFSFLDLFFKTTLSHLTMEPLEFFGCVFF
jgi:hypothetical protein